MLQDAGIETWADLAGLSDADLRSLASRGLAQASPQQLLTQLGRLERSLTGPAPPRIDASWVRLWIGRAQEQLRREASGRSGN